MRDIKFRCWDTENKEMLEVQELDYEDSYNGQPMIRTTMYSDYFDTEDMILMQYVGLKDKNGKEIYEGDIVTGTDYPFIDEGKQNYIGIIVFYDDAASFGYEYQCVRKNKRGISNGINNEFEANENLICENLEVIGNIYDNPELLKKGE